MMSLDEWRNTPAIATATTRSGHGVPVSATAAAATITAALPIASLRLNSQTARAFASPPRCGAQQRCARDMHHECNASHDTHGTGFWDLSDQDAVGGRAEHADTKRGEEYSLDERRSGFVRPPTIRSPAARVP